MVASPKGLGPENDHADEVQTRPVVREGAPNQQTRDCVTVIEIWS
jgi:hypothetical protein